MPIQLTLIGKPGCHLCDEARAIVAQVTAEFLHDNSLPAEAIELVELNILEDQQLALKYAEEIPVLQINGVTHSYWHIPPGRLRAALQSAFGRVS